MMAPRRPQLVVALDVPTLPEAERLTHRLRLLVGWFKIGLQLFTSAGPDAIRAAGAQGAQVVLDLKLHDIPNTVAGAVRAASRHGVAALTLHLAGGEAMLRAAADAREGAHPLLLGVIRLTSRPPDGDGTVWIGRVVNDARRAADLGLDGVVVSVREAEAVRLRCPQGFWLLTPGIRPVGSAPDDQVRVDTPRAAAVAGSDLIVVGRPITRAPDPAAAAAAIVEEIASAGRGVEAGAGMAPGESVEAGAGMAPGE